MIPIPKGCFKTVLLWALDFDRFAVNCLRTDPPVYATSIVADQKSLTIDCLDEMQIVVPLTTDQHNIVLVKSRRIAGLDGDEIAVIDFAGHGVPPRTYLNSLPLAQCILGVHRPTHPFIKPCMIRNRMEP